MSPIQLDLLDAPPVGPAGFRYRVELLSPSEEAALIARFGELPFRPFAFRGYFGKRRTVSFGMHYDFADGQVHQSGPIADFLLPLRDRAAAFAAISPAALEHALVTEYAEGAAIGWHRDRLAFGDIVGISLASACRFRFRRRSAHGWERLAVTLAPRSAYLLRGPARDEWQHSIPPAEELRYSVTFRTLRPVRDRDPPAADR